MSGPPHAFRYAAQLVFLGALWAFRVHAAALGDPVLALDSGAQPLDVATADFNGDRLADLATADYKSLSVTILLATGDGSFRSGDTIGLGTVAPRCLVAGDFTGDGFADLAVAVDELYARNAMLWIYAGDGAGKFTRIAADTIGLGAENMVTEDINGDDQLDIAVACEAANAAYVALNEDAGAHWEIASYVGGIVLLGIELADVNRDGKPDLLTASASAGVSVFPSLGNGTFGDRVDYPAGSGPNDLVAADLTGDGWLDVAVSDYDGSAISFLLGGPNGFSVPHTYGTRPYPWGVDAGDFTHDGLADVVITTEGYYDDSWRCSVRSVAAIFTWAGGDSFRFVQEVPCGNEPAHPLSYDLNGDGWLDFATANHRSNTLTVWYADAVTGDFRPRETYVGQRPVDLATGDLNTDGLPDFVTANASANSATILLSRADGGLVRVAELPARADPSAVALADLNQDGVLDVLLASKVANTLAVYWGRGNGTFAQGTETMVGLGPVALAVGDLDEDGLLDVVTSNEGTYNYGCDCYERGNTLTVLLGDGAGGFRSRRLVPTPKGPGAVTLAQFTSDTHLDIAVLTPGSFLPGCSCYEGSNQIAVLPGDGHGGFTGFSLTDVGTRPMSLVAGDFGGTAALDIAVAHAGFWNNQCNCHEGSGVWVLHGRGDGTFWREKTMYAGPGESDLVLADVTGDGLRDLVVASYVGNSVSVIPRLGDGSFGVKEDYGTGSSPLALVASDLGGDGATDVIVANSWSNTVTTLRNRASGKMPRAPTVFVDGRTPTAEELSLQVKRVSSGLRFEISGAAESLARVSVLDVRGRLVWAMEARTVHTGRIEPEWDGRDVHGVRVPAGIYVCRVSDGAAIVTRRIALLH